MNAQLANDELIAHALDVAYPVDATAYGTAWSELPGAGPSRPRSRRAGLILALAVVLVAVVVLPAIAALNDWWFFGPGSPTATGPVVEVASAPAWVLNAYTSDHGICTVLTETQSPIAAEGCDPDVATSRLSYVTAGGSPGYVFGATDPSVKTITVELSNGTSVTVPTTADPGIDGYRFYVAELPAGASAGALDALDAAGTRLARVTVQERHP